MPRIARIIIPGLPHHVTQRGNNRQDVFFTDDDRRIYLELLQEESTRNGLRLGGYKSSTGFTNDRGIYGRIGGTGNGLKMDPWMWTHWIGMPGDQWRDWLMLGSPQEEIERIRLHTHRGRPLGTDAFLAKIESRLGRRLRPLHVGRPKRKEEKK